MKLLNEKQQIADAVRQWRNDHAPCRLTWDASKQTVQHIQSQLDALVIENTTAADLEQIIGHNYLCRPQTCNECKLKSYEIVQLGDKPHYGTATALICLNCLQKAVTLIRNTFRIERETPNA